MTFRLKRQLLKHLRKKMSKLKVEQNKEIKAEAKTRDLWGLTSGRFPGHNNQLIFAILLKIGLLSRHSEIYLFFASNMEALFKGANDEKTKLSAS